MPATKEEAKSIYNAIKKNGAYYDRLNEDGKKAYWQYMNDNSLVSEDKLNDSGKAEYNRYVNRANPLYGQSTGHIEQKLYKPDSEQDPNGRSFFYSNLEGEKGLDLYERLQMNPQRDSMMQKPAPPIANVADNRRLLNEKRLEGLTPKTQIPTITGKYGIVKPTEGTKMVPVGKAGLVKTPAREGNKLDMALGNAVQGVGKLGLSTLNTINSVVQSPATMGKYGTEEMNKAKAEGKNPAIGLLKGYGKGLGKALTGQEAVSNTEVIEGIAPKTTSALKEKYPGAYNLASNIANFVDITDLLGLGIIADLSKVSKMGKLPDSTKALIKAGDNAQKLAEITYKTKAGEALTDDEKKLVDAIKQDIMYVDTYGNVRKTPTTDLQLEAPKQNLPKVDEFKTITKTIGKPEKTILVGKPVENTINKVSTKKIKLTPEEAQLDNVIKRSSTNIDELIAEAEAKTKVLEEQQFQYLKNNRAKGVQDAGIIRDDAGSVTGRFGKVSNNDKWYRDFYAENNRQPTQAEMREMAKKHLLEGFETNTMSIPANEEYRQAMKDLESYRNIKGANSPAQSITTSKLQKGIQPAPQIIPSTLREKGRTLTTDKPIQSALDARLNKPQIAQGKNIDAPFRITPAENARLFDTPKAPINEVKPLGGINPPPIGKNPFKNDSSVKMGNAIWKNKDYDAPIEVIGDYGTVNGKRYVKIKGSDTGVPLDEVRYMDEAAAAKEAKPSALKKNWDKFYSATVNNTQATANVSKEAEIMSNVARNSGATVDTIIKKGLVNMEGKPIEGKSISDIFNMPEKEAQALEDLLFETHNIDRVKQAKELTGKTTEESRLIIDGIKKQYPHLEAKAKEVNTLLKNLLDEWGVKSGLVGIDQRDLVQGMYKNYVPGYRELAGVDATSFKSRGMGPAKIINKVIGGDDKLMSLQKSIPMLINKMVKSSRKNELYREILKAAENGSPYAKILEPAGKIEEVVQKKANDAIVEAIKADGIDALSNITDSALTADPKLGYMLTVMDNGKPVKLQISEDLFKSLQALNSKGDDDLQAALKLFKKGVTNPFKSLITGYNPLFAIRNVARDIPTAYIQGTENNPFKFAKNLGSAAKDMFKKAPEFQEYKALGGEGGNYFNIEKGLQAKGKLEKPLKVLGAINNFTETWPRYAEYKGTIKREGTDYATKMKALHNAQEVTVNFGRHGDVTKAIDAVVPYLNPAVQGLDKTARTFKKPEAWAKALGVITVPTAAIYAMNQVVDKRGYDQLDNRTKDTNFVFPMGDGTFVKIPKTRESGAVFGALFERILRQVEKQPESFKGYGSTLENNFLIQNPWTDNIASAAVTGLKFNKDFAGRAVVPNYMLMDKRSPRLQFDERTSEIAKEIGDKFNLSPKQIDYIIKSYTGIVGSILIPATTKGGNVLESAVTRSFTADAAYNNEVTNNFYMKLDKLKQAATDKNITQKLSPKIVTTEEKMSNLYSGMTRYISDIKDGISQLGATDEARARQQKLLDVLKELNKPISYNEANRLKTQLITMAREYKK
jgi:hypothetical protein